jgi:tetratricopeptide (TPR) repeat protein
MRAVRFVVVLAVALATAGLSVVPAVAATDPREISAREYFVAGRYQEALDLFAKLYAETLHPNYLRNIGRCYQNLGEPDKAITNFRDYLRKAKNVSHDERTEVEGYIAEMEKLKEQQQKEREAAPKAAESSSETASSAPPPNLNAPAPTATASATLVAAPAGAQTGEQTESGPVYTKWWFWTVIGVAIAGGVGAAFAAGAFKKTQNASCPSGFTCP